MQSGIIDLAIRFHHLQLFVQNCALDCSNIGRTNGGNSVSVSPTLAMPRYKRTTTGNCNLLLLSGRHALDPATSTMPRSTWYEAHAADHRCLSTRWRQTLRWTKMRAHIQDVGRLAHPRDVLARHRHNPDGPDQGASLCDECQMPAQRDTHQA